jgi:hypothetical protein
MVVANFIERTTATAAAAAVAGRVAAAEGEAPA